MLTCQTAQSRTDGQSLHESSVSSNQKQCVLYLSDSQVQLSL